MFSTTEDPNYIIIEKENKTMEYTFPVTRTTNPKPRPADETKLGFAN